MNNREPPQEFLRYADLKAWEPRISFYLLKKWRDAKLLKPRYIGGGWPYYCKTEIKKLLEGK